MPINVKVHGWPTGLGNKVLHLWRSNIRGKHAVPTDIGEDGMNIFNVYKNLALITVAYQI